MQCMQQAKANTANIFAPESPKFPDLFTNAQQNYRWLNSTTRPVAIVTPTTEGETASAVVCAKKNGLLVRPKSGGHDYENLSFMATEPYIMIDLVNIREVTVDLKEESAWVQTGTTLGELYVKISQASPVHGFPGGTCHSVGTGGFISGGGMGMLTRKYGLGADNVLDARVINANGEILDRKAMGEDYFWAIRGGGGGSFGVVVAWKLRLVRVTPLVTTFDKKHFLSAGNLPQLLSKWQAVAPTLPGEMIVRVMLQYSKKAEQVQISFNSQYMGPKEEALKLINSKFPEMNLNETDVHDFPWMNATLTVTGRPANASLDLFLNRTDAWRTNYKGKSDFVTTPIPEAGFQGLLDLLNHPEYELMVIFDPFGGKMDEYPEDALPFPFRKGTLFNVQYLQKWKDNNETESKRNFDWVNKVYAYMEQYVSKAPRTAYVNYKDLDIGSNPPTGNAKYSEAKVWGEKYFKGNFERLSQIKTKVDPDNFFRSVQSIPLYGQ